MTSRSLEILESRFLNITFHPSFPRIVGEGRVGRVHVGRPLPRGLLREHLLQGAGGRRPGGRDGGAGPGGGAAVQPLQEGARYEQGVVGLPDDMLICVH